eukprot:6489052-Amphidinium_carterae.2
MFKEHETDQASKAWAPGQAHSGSASSGFGSAMRLASSSGETMSCQASCKAMGGLRKAVWIVAYSLSQVVFRRTARLRYIQRPSLATSSSWYPVGQCTDQLLFSPHLFLAQHHLSRWCGA